MNNSETNTDLIIGVRGDGNDLLSQDFRVREAGFVIKPLSVVKSVDGKDGEMITLLLAEATTDNSPMNPWDVAHSFKVNHKNEVEVVEPDLVSTNVYQEGEDEDYEDIYSPILGDPCLKKMSFMKHWPHPDPNAAIWHLSSDHSQLKAARERVMDGKHEHVIRIAHFDTGYSNHIMKPVGLKAELGKNYVKNEPEGDATDRANGLNPGHGTGTLGILAGGWLDRPDLGFKDYLGGAPFAEVVPVRISRSVILVKTSGLVKALDYVINLYDDPGTRCDIVTMSMGGLGTWAVTAKINEAYEKGIFVVTATGNNIGGFTPHHVIYPARFRRVLGAAGITYKQTPYHMPGVHRYMQGNFGPRHAMHTVMAAYTPNTPWARMNCDDTIKLSGGGTSSATPQIAAAAAIYLRMYKTDIDKLQGWEKVETIKNALFNAADVVDAEHFGRGILKADRALDIVPGTHPLNKEKVDRLLFPITWPTVVKVHEDPRSIEMIEEEVIQLIQRSRLLQEIIVDKDGEEREFSDLSSAEKQQFIVHILSMEQTSELLKRYLLKYFEEMAG